VTNIDPEIIAMNKVLEAFRNLDKSQASRAIHWVKERLADAMVEKPFEKEDSAKISVTLPLKEEPPTPPIIRRKTLADYDMVLDLFADSDVKKLTDKVLLMSAFLQIRYKFSEISINEINRRFKRIGSEIKNISSVVQELFEKKRPLVAGIGNEAAPDKIRNKFKVTLNGIKKANRLIPEPEETVKKVRKKRKANKKIATKARRRKGTPGEERGRQKIAPYGAR